jgi:TatD DNase family protein
MFDTHAHVHDPAFDPDRDDVLARARAAGVMRILTVGCSLADSARARAAASAHGLDWSLGIHPHEAKEAPANIAAAFDRLRAESPLAPLAIGEIGLDFYYDHSPRERQREVLIEQLRYARVHGLPVIFHQREAFPEFFEVLEREFVPPMRGVVHCFTGDAEQALRLTQTYGLALGIGGVLTFKSAEGLRAAVRAVGLASILLETDCPYLAPVPHRGRRNEPAFLAETAKALAALLDLPVDGIVARTRANADALFNQPAV